MSIKLLAIDIDDTLLTSSHEVHSDAPEMISRALEAGVKVVLCTGVLPRVRCATPKSSA